MPKISEENMVQRSVALPPDLWARVESYGSKLSVVKISHSAAIRDALTRFFDSIGVEVPPASPSKPSAKPSKRSTTKGAKNSKRRT